MNNKDIQQFVLALADFMKHAAIEEQNYESREEARQYAQDYYETKAAELEVTVDYYLAEFV